MHICIGDTSGLRLENVYNTSFPDTSINSSNGGVCASKVGARSVTTTTKHPRHRVGCSCIMCIKPPSSKGKHKPSCTCTVCLTVKRRFKTLMMRKKKRQLERDIAQQTEFVWTSRGEAEVESLKARLSFPHEPLENYRTPGKSSKHFQTPDEVGNSQLDLNCNPDSENLQPSSSHVSMLGCLQEANLPLETYPKQNGLTSLVSDEQASSESCVPEESIKQVEVQSHIDQSLSHGNRDQEISEVRLLETYQAGEDCSQNSSS